MDCFLVISVIITIIVGGFQIKRFRETKWNLDIVKNFFPEVPDYLILNDESGNTSIGTTSEGEIKTLMTELNQYIESNKGTTDFSIIQNKTERRTDTVYEKATAKISFPTYIGLMGTFLGVLIGLIGFAFFGDEETRVDNLVRGVMASMATSLLGLWLTTRGNRLAADTKEILETRKNLFYDFLQNSLMPSLGTSMVAALDRLRHTLGTFEPTFSSVIGRFETSFTKTIDLFKTTFDSCTVNFGEEFRKNSELLNHGVDKMAHSVDLINTNVDNQRQLLEEIRSTKMWDTLKQFINVAEVLEKSAIHIEGLRDVVKMIDEQVRALMNAQEEYTKSLVVPKILTERINNLLDRVSTFEKSINNLGPAISSTELIATKELNDIKAHLDRIAQRNFEANRYAEMQTDNLNDFFAEQAESIRQLNDRYRAMMEEHGEKLNEVLEESIATLAQKRSAFLRAIDDAFDVAEVNTQFSYLEALPRLETALSKLEEQLSADHAEMIDATSKRPAKEDLKPLDTLLKIGKSVASIDESAKESKHTMDSVRENMVTIDVIDSMQNKDSAQLDKICAEIVKLASTANSLSNTYEKKTATSPSREDISRLLANVEEKLEQISKNTTKIGSRSRRQSQKNEE